MVWCVLDFQVERCGFEVELESPAKAYCRDVMFADRSILEQAEHILR